MGAAKEVRLPWLVILAVGLLWGDLWLAVWCVQNEVVVGDTAWLSAAGVAVLIFGLFQLGLLRTRVGRTFWGGVGSTLLFVFGAILVFTLDGAIFHPGLIKDAAGDAILIFAVFLDRLLLLGIPGGVVAVLVNIFIQWIWRSRKSSSSAKYA